MISDLETVAKVPISSEFQKWLDNAISVRTLPERLRASHSLGCWYVKCQRSAAKHWLFQTTV